MRGSSGGKVMMAIKWYTIRRGIILHEQKDDAPG